MSELSGTLPSQPVKWYRSTMFAAFMVACTAFTCPGIFGALNEMGAGGGASPQISNAANAIVFGVIAIGSLFVGAICNRITPKWTLFIGTLGYVPYAAGLYVVDQFGSTGLLLFGAVCIGISGCFLWVSSGAIFLGYTEEHRKGTAASIKFAMQNLGASIGGIISLALNVESNYRGSVTKETYIVLMTIMGLGFPFALALPPIEKVQRTDGRKVALTKSPSLAQEFALLGKLLRNPTVLAITPLMLYAQWFLSYQWQFNFAYFTVRSRALLSALFYLTGLFGALIFGQVLDWQRFSRRTRAKIGFFVIIITSGTSWILGQILQVQYPKTLPTFDWDEDGFGLPCFLFVLWGLSDPLVTTYMFWLTGSLTNNVSEMAFLAGLINSVGSLGSTFGFVVSAMDFNYNGACALNVAFFFASLPSLAWVVFARVTDSSHGKDLTVVYEVERGLSGTENERNAQDEK
ncbi:MFS general substrate transporter [Thozetella sp. PMI_491]|nr:MFS general substrate transporter [Thozetella sp. PMI_491]